MKKSYVVALCVVLVLALVTVPLASAQGWLTRFENVLIEGNAMLVDGYMTIGNGTPTTAQTNETLYVEGAIESDGAANIAGALTLGGALLPSSATITPGAAAYALTPTASLYIVASSAAVSVTLAACTHDGQIVTLVGQDNNNVTINDSNVYTHDGAAEVIAQYDVVRFMCVSTKWHQLGLTAADS